MNDRVIKCNYNTGFDDPKVVSAILNWVVTHRLKDAALEQWFLTFFAWLTPKIMNGLHRTLNKSKVPFKGTINRKLIHLYDTHGPQRPSPRTPSEEPML